MHACRSTLEDPTTFDTAVNAAGVAAIVDVGDFNEDGKLDLVRGVTADGVASVSLGNGDLTFAAATSSAASLLIASAEDFDGDGHLDLILSGTNADQQTFIIPGNGDGTFDTAIAFPLALLGNGDATDLTGDNLPDLVFVNDGGATQTLTAFVNTPTGPNLVGNLTNEPPSLVVGGVKGRLNYRIFNDGNAAFSGAVQVRLVVSSDVEVGSDDAALLTPTPKNIKLAPGKSKTLKLNLTFPTNLPDAFYSILAQLEQVSGAVQESPTFDNLSIASVPVRIAPPFIDLASEFAVPIAPAFKSGKSGRVSIGITNLGNTLAKGDVTATLRASTDGQLDTADPTVATLTVKYNAKPDQRKGYRLTFPVNPAIATGSYTLFVQFSAPTLNETSLENNTIMAEEPFVIQ